MPRPLNQVKRFLAGLALAGCGASACHAAELGEVTARSYIGQPLVADIELSALAPDEMSGMQVRLASADVYRGANISMNPALQAATLSVVRSGARQHIHISSFKPVDASYVHLFLELSAAGRSDVRAATVWLAADPAPRPPPAPPPVTPPVHSNAPVTASAHTGVAPAAPLLDAALAARARAARLAAEGVAGDHAAPEPESSAVAALPAPAQRRTLTLVGKPRTPVGSACGPHGLTAEGVQCRVFEEKNVALTGKLAELEEKIRQLQGQVGAAPHAGASAHAAADRHGDDAPHAAQARQTSAAAQAASGAHAAPVSSATPAASAAASHAEASHADASAHAALAPASASAHRAEAAHGAAASHEASASAPTAARPLPLVKPKPLPASAKGKAAEGGSATRWGLITAVALLMLLCAGGLFWFLRRNKAPVEKTSASFLSKLLRRKKSIAADPSATAIAPTQEPEQ